MAQMGEASTSAAASTLIASTTANTAATPRAVHPLLDMSNMQHTHDAGPATPTSSRFRYPPSTPGTMPAPTEFSASTPSTISAAGNALVAPTLLEVLARRSNPPVCLYNYYLYLRDQEQAQHYLDFWLDVTAHENRCRIYCKNIIRASKRFTMVTAITTASSEAAGTSSAPPHKLPDRASWGRLSIRDVSNELRYSTISHQTGIATLDHSEGTMSMMSEASGSQRYRYSKNSDQLQVTPSVVVAAADGDGANQPDTASTGPTKKVTRDEIQKSARKIYRRYMVPGARRELHFPESIRYPIVQAVEVETRDDPDVFMEAKEYVFRLMDQCYFPRFIKERSLHNISRKQAVLRLVAGLVALFIGFTTMTSLILLNRPRVLRLYGLIPVFIAVVNLLTYAVRFCPIFALFKVTEIVFMRYAPVKDYAIRRYHRQRAILHLSGALLISAIVVGIYMAPPGHRL